VTQQPINFREIAASDEIKLVEVVETQVPVLFWEQKQKEIVTSVVDYNLDTLDSLIRKGLIDLKPKYQRRFRWDDARKSKLIESFFMNVPVPPIFLNEDTYGKYSVIDGKQRLIAVSDFLNDRFAITGLKVFTELNDKKFSELPDELKSVITTRPTLRAVIILRQSDSQIKFEVFERLNTGGIKLNAQEIRNSAFTGSLNDLILDLSENKLFHSLLGIKIKSKSSIHREMKDAELVLRFFTFIVGWKEFRGGIARSLDKFMSENRHISEEIIEEKRKLFTSAIEKVEAAFGDYAFKRWNPETKKWRSPILSALYDAQMIAVEQFDIKDLSSNRDEIIKGMKELFEDESFQKNVDAAIPSYFVERIERVITMIKSKI
jgi:hypothetical protein